MKKNLTLFSLAFLVISFPSWSQDFPFGAVSLNNLNMKQYAGDTAASAVELIVTRQQRGSSGE